MLECDFLEEKCLLEMTELFGVSFEDVKTVTAGPEGIKSSYMIKYCDRDAQPIPFFFMIQQNWSRP